MRIRRTAQKMKWISKSVTTTKSCFRNQRIGIGLFIWTTSQITTPSVTKSVISFYELRERTPSPEILVKLAATFCVSSDYLLGIEKGKTIDITGLDFDDEKALRMIVAQLRKKHNP